MSNNIPKPTVGTMKGLVNQVPVNAVPGPRLPSPTGTSILPTASAPTPGQVTINPQFQLQGNGAGPAPNPFHGRPGFVPLPDVAAIVPPVNAAHPYWQRVRKPVQPPTVAGKASPTLPSPVGLGGLFRGM